ncbi:bidirectional sugar transporter SWEET17-like isoform X2 [Juglans microcarpa x Juglans regia]|uniref:bidirectional sugar transporter SWEET17-like isoform X2 n=1 Tax=Juglans microcarpa x Juglans regia TaxID=2249226 RepID=UPI001B7F15FB|nr:bidirectional sugar transporter SWEET17-like isoform X2 [Juglans microcarpa x Juglans regia]
MEELSFYIGIIGNIISVLMFLSPVGTFWRIIKQRSTEQFESLPYICTLLNSSLWTYYGIIKAGELLVATVNGFGILVETIYVTLFLIYAPARSKMTLTTCAKQKIQAKTVILVGLLDVGFLAAAILVTRLALQGETRIDAVGFLGAALNIVMYSSPLAVMRTVVTTKSVEYMPFFLSFFLFLNGGTWAFYALLVRDYFLLVPNGSGFLLGTVQLVLYAIYRKPNLSKNVSDHRLEEGWQQQAEPLISSTSSRLIT